MGAGTRTTKRVGWGLAAWLLSVPVVEAQGVTRIRTIAEGVYESASLLAEATRRSPTIRRMVAALDETDVIVYVELTRSLPNRSGCLTFVNARGGVRMLRISIDMRSIVDDQIKWLGHEMAHALEVASAPEVQDSARLARLFQRIGHPVEAGSTDFETNAAVAVGHQVQAEIAGKK